MADTDLTRLPKHELLAVARGLEAQSVGSRVIAIEILKSIAAQMPDPPHTCECSECAERGKWVHDFKMVARELLTEYPTPYARINDALARMRTLLNYSDGH